MKKILLFTILALSVFSVRAQNPLVGKPSLKLVFDVAQTKKWEWTVDTNNNLTINGTGGTPTITYSDFTGTGTSLAAFNASGVFTRITNGSNGQFLTLTGGVPTWTASPATSPGGSTTQLQYNNAGAFGGITNATSNGTNLTLAGAPSAASATWSNIGAITTGDWNGGTIDGTTIGASSPSTGAFTTLSASAATTLTTANNSPLIINRTGTNGTATTWQLDGAAVAQMLVHSTNYAHLYGEIGKELRLGANGLNNNFSINTSGNATFSGTVSGAFNGTIGATTPSTGAFTTGAFSGNVGIGTTVPSGIRLQVIGTPVSNFLSKFEAQFGDVSTNAVGISIDKDATNGYGLRIRRTDDGLWAGTNPVDLFGVQQNGTVNVGTGDLQFGGTTAISSARAATLSAVRSTDLAGTGSDIVYADADGDLTRSTVEIANVYSAGGADVAVADGGTGASTLTGVLIGNGTSAVTGTSTSSGISGAISDETGSGALVFATSPTFTTPTLGAASATSLTLTTDLTVPNGGTGASTLTGVLIGNGTAAFTGAATSSGIAGAISDELGTGSLVFEETGTWSPEYQPTSGAFGTVTYQVQQGYYRVIGDVVFFNIFLRTSEFNLGTGSGNLLVSLPGSLASNSDGPWAVTVGSSSNWGGDHPSTASIPDGPTSVINLRYRTTANGGDLTSQCSDLQTGVVAAANSIIISGYYYK